MLEFSNIIFTATTSNCVASLREALMDNVESLFKVCMYNTVSAFILICGADVNCDAHPRQKTHNQKHKHLNLWVCKYTFIAEEELRSKVKDNLPTFIRQTNWTFLLPHLVSVDLSDSVATDYLLSESKSHQEKGVHFYLRVLPSKGPDAYTRFHRCLCDEKEHLGHQSLQQLLQSCDK